MVLSTLSPAAGVPKENHHQHSCSPPAKAAAVGRMTDAGGGEGVIQSRAIAARDDKGQQRHDFTVLSQNSTSPKNERRPC